MISPRQIHSYWQALPLTLTLLGFLVFPICVILVVSFWDYNEYSLIPDFILENYEFLLTSKVTLKAYIQTFKYAFLTWFFTFLIGFTVAYFLAFHVRSQRMQTILFLLCTVPFFTSNIIRMISWIPLLGRNGLVNSALQTSGVIEQPLDWLLYSDFAIILAYVHLYTMFMVVPIFNSMMRIDRNLVEAAVDAGAAPWQILKDIIVPLSKSGIMVGSIFVFTLVMGDFITVKIMGGGIKANVATLIYNEISLLQYPAAAAGAIILLITVLMMLMILFRLVDVRKEL
ncbi:ABC transporter permease [Marinomonas mediterranea]|jgi:ABC-type spermidine/putrescine transport system, permease component I|uniref:ABC-type transporter, integral membrane subunit n=1 Tax=Marinomonas mediterranea (strain ATCC 700492 / JCM 21426 / NBRC 103028 / MMB-1) TaxID=717774 RepID=F2JXG8_MARM1|nr:ABC transporter permease [Marinomonas mediterranea]ADZ91868.1 ABC-type transporter, integral membrane subunit [Marinomonas mediterranea MMB-1]WCN09823.1 ABC transporter permease subunit [Marinomonas mediterranea]WCN13907.1 ABC transporter permease subunit [Marinomonas mediterranea]WCN17962.1 ABC transporter permease subunit [Marinomonas mediterranea MMB-1]